MKPKVLILQQIITPYRAPVFDLIAQKVDLTVGYFTEDQGGKDRSYRSVKLEYKKICGLFIIKKLFRFCQQFDVVFFVNDLHCFSCCLLPFLPGKYKVIPWSIGFRVSYTRRYDTGRKKTFADLVYRSILNKSDAMLFYTSEAIKFWGNTIDKKKVFIAHNTVKVSPIENDDTRPSKDRIIFIGTLYKEKKIYELIDAFIEVRRRCSSGVFFKLDIVGNGSEYKNIEKIIKDKNLSDNIILHGAIFDEEKIASLFAGALLCVSPDQAGLSVLKSMGYGVPYVTRSNAITGGERFNIDNRKNGLLYDSQSELTDIIEDAFRNPENYLSMGRKAREYYVKHASIERMVQGFLDAVEYVLK